MADDLGMYRPGVRILELGSGLGWLGMTLARNLPDAEMVVLTEQEAGGGLDWLRHNVALNSHLPGQAAVRTAACDWLHYGGEGGGEVTCTLQAGRADEGEERGSEAADPEAPTQVVLAADLGCIHSACAGGSRPNDSTSTTSLPVDDPCGSGQSDGGDRDVASGDCPGRGGDSGRFGLGDGDDGSRQSDAGGIGGSSGGQGGGTGGGGGGGEWLSSQRWDFILGSDLVYNDVGAVYLPRVLRTLAHPDTRILYCHTKHRFDTFDVKLHEQLAACGLACREVHEPSVASPPPSPPPLTELFPEMRIAVYDIRQPEATVAGPA